MTLDDLITYLRDLRRPAHDRRWRGLDATNEAIEAIHRAKLIETLLAELFAVGDTVVANGGPPGDMESFKRGVLLHEKLRALIGVKPAVKPPEQR